MMFNCYYDPWHTFGFPNPLCQRKQHVPGTIPIGILDMAWVLMLGMTKSVYLSGSGTSEPENWPIYILAISEWIKGTTGTVIYLGRKILNYFRGNFASWHEVLSKPSIFCLTVKQMLWPRMSATNQKVCAVVTELRPSMFPVFSIRNQSWFIISKETVIKFFHPIFWCFNVNCLGSQHGYMWKPQRFLPCRMKKNSKMVFALKSKSPACAGSVPFSISFLAKGRRAQLSFALVCCSEQFVWESITFG